MEAEGVENEWAQERVRRLLGAVMQQPEQKSMTVTMGGVRLTVSGPGMAVLIAPEVGVDQPESRGRGGT